MLMASRKLNYQPIGRLDSLTPISKAEICKALPDVSPTTVEAVLGDMVKNASIKRVGAGRASRYIKA